MPKIATLPQVIVMIDFETFGLGPKPIVLQGALAGLDLATDEIFSRSVHAMHYPAPPQQLLLGDNERKIDFKTVLFWLDQPDDARKIPSKSDSEDINELVSALRHLVAQFNYITDDGQLPYEVWTQGPQADIVWIETLLQALGIAVPWTYDRVRDLRTLLALSQLDLESVPRPEGYVKHDSYWDVIHQIDLYRAAVIALRARA